MKFCKLMPLATVLRGNEAWTVTKKDAARI